MEELLMARWGESGPPNGESGCGRNPSGTPGDRCGAQAAWHIMWDSGCNASLACEACMPVIQLCWMYADRHRVGPDCNMPGGLWFLRPVSRCEVPKTGTEVSVVHRFEDLLGKDNGR